MNSPLEWPPVPGDDWTYAELRTYERKLVAWRHSGQASRAVRLALANSLQRRCAHRAATTVLHDSLSGWADARLSNVGIQPCLAVIGSSLQCLRNEIAEFWVRDLAANLDVINPGNVAMMLERSLGTGLQPEVREILRHCRPLIEDLPGIADMVDVLLAEFEEVSALAPFVPLISLGTGCHPWLQFNRYMLRKVERADLAMPFNLMANASSSSTQMLEDGFCGLQDPSLYTLRPFLRDIPAPVHTGYSIIFNHDCDDEFIVDGMSALRRLYLARSRAFLQRTSGPRVYVRVASVFGEVGRLEEALARHMQDDRYRLLLISCQRGRAPEMPAVSRPTTKMVHVPYPTANYNWAADYTTPEGCRFDLAMRRCVLDVMREAAEL